MVKPYKTPSPTLADRLATALGSAAFAAVTLFAVFILIHNPFRWDHWRYALFENFYSPSGLVFGIGGASIVGFLIGPKLMAEVWGAIWSVFD